jgi:hypothetical protein
MSIITLNPQYAQAAPPIQWVESFLADRKTIMVLLEGAMGEFNVKTGIPQGSLLSPILFLFLMQI